MPLPTEIQSTKRFIRNEILRTVSASPHKLTPIALQKTITQRYVLKKNYVKSIIQDLVSAGELVYTYQLGCTFLEKSFNRPVRISNDVVLKPPESQYRPKPQEIVIQIKPGAAFGTGQHPTTRLCLRGIEYALKYSEYLAGTESSSAIDIGTGSGILAIAAIKFGVKRAVGIDIDPCARAEARENVRINALFNEIEISSRRIEAIEQRFSLATANLRYPSLKRFSNMIFDLLENNGIAVFSGIKADELQDLLALYTQKRFTCLWKEFEGDWAAIVLKKRANLQ
jgi:ribosomal protein L11 methyltransferase